MRLWIVLLSSLLLSGCYTLQAVQGHLDLMARRVPIERAIERTEDPVLRGQLERALALRDFASRELGLPDNESYRTYADLERPFVVWNVVATPTFSVEPVAWCFPVAGCVPYRGYYSEDAANRSAARLAARGHDVVVSGITAYSTLGRFADPLLNTMLGDGEVALAATIFHELAHQRFYRPGDAAFNEAFATVVEETGVRRWLEAIGTQNDLEAYLAGRARRAELAQAMRDTRERLRVIYASAISETEMRARKAAEFDALRATQPGLRHIELNNAHLASAATYHELVPALDALLAACDGDLACFYAAVEER